MDDSRSSDLHLNSAAGPAMGYKYYKVLKEVLGKACICKGVLVETGTQGHVKRQSITMHYNML